MDATHLYGLTKGLAEHVCRWFSVNHGLSILALRLYAPASREVWLEQCRKRMPNGFTTHADLARAYNAALRLTNHTGFDVLFISGDQTGTYVNYEKAGRMLGWQPRDRFPA